MRSWILFALIPLLGCAHAPEKKLADIKSAQLRAAIVNKPFGHILKKLKDPQVEELPMRATKYTWKNTANSKYDCKLSVVVDIAFIVTDAYFSGDCENEMQDRERKLASHN